MTLGTVITTMTNITKRSFGVDLHSGEVPPTTFVFDKVEELYEWFQDLPTSETGSIRILCVQIERPNNSELSGIDFELPIPRSILESAVWRPEVYYNLASTHAGGAAGLVDIPWRFILQTPLDGGPFCSLAMSCKPKVVKGVYIFDKDFLNPAEMTDGNASISTWESSGLQIVTLPQKFLQAHSGALSQRLARTITKVRSVERVLELADQEAPDFVSISRTLHACNMELVDLERRSRFEQTVVNAIETIVVESRTGARPRPQVALQQAAIASRQFDFESLPRRMENARTTVNSLIQQRTQALNLELTHASHQIAEATLSDARSMKTIAILTMVLLPATAVASLFSMNLFDWSAKDGGDIANRWLWIYFVVTIPLTVIILASWWYWNRRTSRRLTAKQTALHPHQSRRFTDEETAIEEPSSDPESDNAKMVMIDDRHRS